MSGIKACRYGNIHMPFGLNGATAVAPWAFQDYDPDKFEINSVGDLGWNYFTFTHIDPSVYFQLSTLTTGLYYKAFYEVEIEDTSSNTFQVALVIRTASALNTTYLNLIYSMRYVESFSTGKIHLVAESQPFTISSFGNYAGFYYITGAVAGYKIGIGPQAKKRQLTILEVNV